MLGIGFAGGSDLQCQLAGRHQNQYLRLAARRVDARQQRQGEGGGLAGAGLRLADHVVAFEDHRDRLGLDRRRLFVANCGDGCENIGVNTERGEADGFLGHGFCLLKSAKTQ
ncbi:hypothetical protein D9M73_280400 [compost metagenome]